eukprot:UN24722
MYSFGYGVEGGDTEDACTDGIVLTAVTNTFCDVQCKEGWIEQEGTVDCSIDGALTGELECVAICDAGEIDNGSTTIVYESFNSDENPVYVCPTGYSGSVILTCNNENREVYVSDGMCFM